MSTIQSLLDQEQPEGFLSTPVLGPDFDASKIEAQLPDSPLDMPEEVGPYRVVELLNQSWMASVFLAHPTDHPREKVAVKVLSPGAVSPARLKRFETEANILRHLKHDGIAKLLRIGTFDRGRGSEPYVAMEFVEGLSLLDHCLARSPTFSDRLWLLIEISEAVHAAHQQGVIHRDLKPANILVTPSGKPKILDFGIARTALPDLRVTERLTADGEFLGTIRYMSPEQVYGSPLNVDVRSDLYAIGIIAYDLLAASPPYSLDGCSRSEQIQRIREVPPIPIRELRPNLPRDIELVLLKCLEKEKESRYPAVHALSSDLSKVASGRTPSIRPPRTIDSLRSFAFENRAVAALFGGIAVLAVILLIREINNTFVASERVRITHETLSLLANARDYIGPDNQAEFINAVRTARTEALGLVDETGDPRARASLADLYLAEVTVTQAGPGYEKAIDHALGLYQDLVELDPNNTEYLSSLSICLVKQGDFFKSKNLIDRARRRYEEALEIDETVVSLTPSNLEYLDNLTWSYERLGEIALHQRRDLDAYRHFKRHLALARRLLQMNPKRLLSRFSLYMALAHTANHFHNLVGDQGMALEHCREAREHIEILVQADRKKTRYRSHRVLTYSFLASLERIEGDPGRSMPLLKTAHQEALAIGAAHGTFINLLGSMATLHSEAGNLEEAQDLSIQALERHNLAVLETDTALTPQLHHRQGALHEMLASILIRQGRYEEALAHERIHLGLLETFTSFDSARNYELDSYADAFLTSPIEELRDPTKALRAARHALKMKPVSFRTRLLLADSLAALGHDETARERYHELLDNPRCPKTIAGKARSGLAQLEKR